jgi:hypothetical protein
MGAALADASYAPLVFAALYDHAQRHVGTTLPQTAYTITAFTHFGNATTQTVEDTIAVGTVTEKVVGLDALAAAMHAVIVAAVTLIMD